MCLLQVSWVSQVTWVELMQCRCFGLVQLTEETNQKELLTAVWNEPSDQTPAAERCLFLKSYLRYSFKYFYSKNLLMWPTCIHPVTDMHAHSHTQRHTHTQTITFTHLKLAFKSRLEWAFFFCFFFDDFWMWLSAYECYWIYLWFYFAWTFWLETDCWIHKLLINEYITQTTKIDLFMVFTGPNLCAVFCFVKRIM